MLIEVSEIAEKVDREIFVEVDPTGRYGRYKEVLAVGAVKVYKAFDQEQGIEVAWNQVQLRGFMDEPVMLNRLFGEVCLLKSLDHPHIISLHKQWVDPDHRTLNFIITEICNSGDLRGYRQKHKQVSLKALKKWARQVLLGLDYLHTHDPCVIHRDLNYSNIFINGNLGEQHRSFASLYVGNNSSIGRVAASTSTLHEQASLGGFTALLHEQVDHEYTNNFQNLR